MDRMLSPMSTSKGDHTNGRNNPPRAYFSAEQLRRSSLDNLIQQRPSDEDQKHRAEIKEDEGTAREYQARRNRVNTEPPLHHNPSRQEEDGISRRRTLDIAAGSLVATETEEESIRVHKRDPSRQDARATQTLSK